MSALGSKLRSLRQQAGDRCHETPTSNAPEPGCSTDALRKRLQQADAGRRRETLRRKRISDQRLAESLGGKALRDGVIGIREQFPADAVHGRFPLANMAGEHAHSLCTSAAGAIPRACVFMDTETTGLAGGTGTLVFLLGMARFSAGALEVLQLLLTGFHGERAMLDEARAFLRHADALVTFNGRSFDAPLLAARYRLAELSDPFAALRHLDLLHPTRRTFKHHWPDCRLQTAERRLLGVQRIDDLPGSEAPQAWFDWVRHGRHGTLSAVCAHNRLDLLSLVVLPVALRRSHEDPVASGANILACARQWSQDQAGGPSERVVFEYLLQHRPALDFGARMELARLARGNGEWKLALELWGELADLGSCAAIEQLAKYFEHKERDFAHALALTTRLLNGAPHDPRYLRRDARLRARLSRNPC